MELLQVHEAVKRFGGLTAVDKVSLTVARGEIRAVIGPNGSGKSTFINVLSGVYKPDSGTIVLDGRHLENLPPSEITKAGIARTFQNIQLFEGLTVLENVAVGKHCRMTDGVLEVLAGGRRHRAIEQHAREEAYRLLETMGIPELASHYPGELPYGQRRLVEIARALAAEPKLLMVDEPAAGLSAQEMNQLGDVLLDLKEKGISVIVIEHNMKFVMGLSDRVTVLNFGRVIAEGTPDQVRRDPVVVEAYLGGSHAHAAG